MAIMTNEPNRDYSVSVPITPNYHTDDSYRAHVRTLAKEHMIRGLAKIMEPGRVYTFQMRETEPPGDDGLDGPVYPYTGQPAYQLSFTVGEVQKFDYVYTVPSVTDLPLTALTHEATRELKRRVKRFLSALWPQQLTYQQVQADIRDFNGNS